MNIGPFTFDQPVALAPMAGVSDRPLRVLARRFGADYAVTEMVCAETRLWHSRKTRPRLDIDGEAAPRIVQIAGGKPRLLADAARAAVDLGADVVDINMGCPAKKVLDAHAGSALLRDEALVGAILDAVVAAVSVPVTLKMRTGWSPERRNGVAVARLAEQAGIAALTVHGRTRACAFRGHAEYATIAAIKQAVRIPVIANGDITTPAEALAVLAETGADGLMIGRAARGRPWLFAAIKAALAGRAWQPPSTLARLAVMREHLAALHAHYGVDNGLRIARKHIAWYLEGFADGAAWRQRFVRLEQADQQFALLDELASAPAWRDAA
ncbi:MAG: tRNA dihydrouridine synthase DusB [Gammaproteobacteria bacterium]